MSTLASRMTKVPGSAIAGGMSLKRFIQRAEVLKLYRQTLRLCKPLDKSQSDSVREFARYDIESVKHITDENHISMLLTEGKRKVQQFELQLAMVK